MSGMAYKISLLCLLITAARAGDVPSFQVPVNSNQPTNIQITVTAIPAAPTANSLQGIRYTTAFEHQQQYNPNALAYAPPQFQFSPIQFNSIAEAPAQAQPAFHIRAIPIQFAPHPVHLADKAAPPAPLQLLAKQPAPIQTPFQIVAKEAEYNPSVQVEANPVQASPLQFQLRPLQVQYAPAEQPAAPVAVNQHVQDEAKSPLQFLLRPLQVQYAPPEQPAAPLAVNQQVQVEAKSPLQFQLRPLQVQYAAAAPPVAPVAVQPAAVVKKVKYVKKEEYDANPQYEYGYDIDDAQTGDSKSQNEQRQGNFVQGSYSVVDPDGHKRTVEYTADPINGFSAVVRREPVQAKALHRNVGVSRNYNQ
ncbi:unnamed protein product [Phyllotreta striolata]|uniref:Uncharacterized protein n=1 Tax=Phyllotreta striolata TaxID=444603 RepID=A0A9N9TKX2_PHYSR|nr:unnamed protein product [Phyllotreta striolata]